MVRLPDPDGTDRLQLTIGSGPPPPLGELTTGPSAFLNFETDRRRLAATATPGPRAAAPARTPVERVTLYAKQPLRGKETPLANVLRQLADSSGRPVVCRWPTGDSRVKQRLREDLIDQPMERALAVLRERYGLKAEKGDPCITLQPNPRQAPAAPGVRPAPGA